MAYSESDTRSKLIDPSIKSSGWLESNIVREISSNPKNRKNY